MKKTWFAVGVVTLWPLGVFVPSTVFAQHEPGNLERGSVQSQHGPSPQEGPAYDTKSEATFKGTVAKVKTGRSALYWLFRIHTMGLEKMRTQDKHVLLNTDTGTVEIQLGPTQFLKEKEVEIRKGDTLEVTGSRGITGESQVILPREIRKGDNVWTLRDVAGQPLWSSSQGEARSFSTKKKVVLAVVAIKAAATAAVFLAK